MSWDRAIALQPGRQSEIPSHPPKWCGERDATGIYWVETRDAAMHRAPSPLQRKSRHQMSAVRRLRSYGGGDPLNALGWAPRGTPGRAIQEMSYGDRAMRGQSGPWAVAWGQPEDLKCFK